jgi:hypothetical protein
MGQILGKQYALINGDCIREERNFLRLARLPEGALFWSHSSVIVFCRPYAVIVQSNVKERSKISKATRQ